MKINKKLSTMILTMFCVIALATVAVSAATYSKTKSQNVVAGPCSATYSVTATYNTSGNTRWTGKYGISNIKNSSGYIIQTKGLDVNFDGAYSTMTIKYNSKNLNNYSETAVQGTPFSYRFAGNSVQ